MAGAEARENWDLFSLAGNRKRNNPKAIVTRDSRTGGERPVDHESRQELVVLPKSPLQSLRILQPHRRVLTCPRF